MPANPLNTALLCLICEELHGIFPESRTQLYEEIVRCILRRYRRKKGLPETTGDLVEVCGAQLKHLGQIALNGLLEDNLDFEERELRSHPGELPGFGFLSVETGGSKLRPRRHYSFLHKSFQECFAAFYLCCQLLKKEISVDMLAADRRYFEQHIYEGKTHQPNMADSLMHSTNSYPGSPFFGLSSLPSSKTFLKTTEHSWTKTILSREGRIKLFNSSLMNKLIRIE